MLNKLEFNNLVITNKKIIQQARTQTIAKVVQKLRKVKDALEKKPDDEANKARQRKNVEYIAQLKSLKQVEIMRLLLLKDEKQHKAVLTNGRATPDEVVIAMLGLNKLMQALIAKFKATLKLSSDLNANWREEILETSKRRQKLQRTEEKRRKRKELKDLKAQSRNRLEWLEKNKPEIDAEVDKATATETKTISTTAGDVQVEKVEIEAKSVKKLETISSNAKPKKMEKQPKLRKQREPEEKLLKKVENKQKIQEKLQKKVEKKQKLQEKPIQSEAVVKKPKIEEKERPTHVEDPFFLTESGQPYLSTAVVMSDDDNATDNDEYQPEPNWRNKQENSSRRYNEKPITTKEQFQGKRTKFADDGSAAETISSPSLAAAPSAESSETAGMHPSWIAKQKLKPKIAAFMGTKIKFDD